jgi:hypothetical protein
MIRKLIILIFVIPFWGLSQQIFKAEYFFDNDPGVGNAIPIAITSGAQVNHSMTISTEGLDAGFHMLFIRTNANTTLNGTWGHYIGRMFYLQEPILTNAYTITEAEWFIDTDPGVGNATSISVNNGTTVSSALAIPTNLASGFHFLHIRTKNSSGIWGHYQSRMFYLLEPITAINSSIIEAEYFIDTDPGIGNGIQIPLTSGTQINHQMSIDISAVTPGFHYLHIRSKNTEGIWGHYQGRMFYVREQETTILSPIVSAEYFIDTDPGLGNGIAFSIDEGLDINEITSVGTSLLSSGEHYVFVRVIREDG